jgi:hypothetical protein
MNLTDLLTAATTEEAPISAVSAARLLTAAADDRRDLNLGLIPKAPALTVELDTKADWTLATVAGVLRYAIDDTTQTLERLCTNPECDNESTGRGFLTRVCPDHLDTLVPGLLPNAGDDILPGDRETARTESLRMRVAAWADEVTEDERPLAGHRRVMATLLAKRTH